MAKAFPYLQTEEQKDAEVIDIELETFGKGEGYRQTFESRTKLWELYYHGDYKQLAEMFGLQAEPFLEKMRENTHDPIQRYAIEQTIEELKVREGVSNVWYAKIFLSPLTGIASIQFVDVNKQRHIWGPDLGMHLGGGIAFSDRRFGLGLDLGFDSARIKGGGFECGGDLFWNTNGLKIGERNLSFLVGPRYGYLGSEENYKGNFAGGEVAVLWEPSSSWAGVELYYQQLRGFDQSSIFQVGGLKFGVIGVLE